MSAIEIAKKNELISLVRKVAKHWGESEENFKWYIADILSNDRQKAIDCFRLMAEQCRWIPEITPYTGQG